MAGNLPSLFDDDIFFSSPGEAKKPEKKKKKPADSQTVKKETGAPAGNDEHPTEAPQALSDQQPTEDSSPAESLNAAVAGETNTPASEEPAEPPTLPAGKATKERTADTPESSATTDEPATLSDQQPAGASQPAEDLPAWIRPSLELPEPAPKPGRDNEKTTSTVQEPEEKRNAIFSRPKENALQQSFRAHEVEIIAPKLKSKPAEPNRPEPETTVPDAEYSGYEPDETSKDRIGLPEWQLDKNYYTIGEVAGFFKVNISHIRFWTKEFKLKPRTTRKGDRLYTPEQIGRLRLIHHLVKEKKHTLQGAKERLQSRSEKVNRNLQLKDALTALRATLVELRNDLG